MPINRRQLLGSAAVGVSRFAAASTAAPDFAAIRSEFPRATQEVYLDAAANMPLPRYVAEGMRRYGYRDHAATLIAALLDAAGYFDHLLPEVFAGYPRDLTSTPVEYPTACRPHAWAAGAPLLGLRTLLGLDTGTGGLTVAPHLGPGLGHVRLDGIPVRGRRERAG